MISRLLLVGMVGVLGISLPDGADLGMGLTWARPGATVCACRRAAVTFELIAVGDDTTNRIADELNRRSEGLDLPAAAIVRVVAKDRPASVVPVKVDAVAEMFAENEVWAGSAAEVVASIARPAASLRPSVASAAPVVPAVKADAVAEMFAKNEVWAGSATEVVASVAQPAAVPQTDGVAEMFAKNEVWAGSAAEVVASIARHAASLRPTFEPIATAEADSGIAAELNRASEGLDLPRNPEPSVGTALRLTRDAALAWMNVLAKTIATEHVR